jgi:hypothetical protein
MAGLLGMEIHLCLEIQQGYVPLILSGWWSSSSSFWKTSYSNCLMSREVAWNRSWKSLNQEKGLFLMQEILTTGEKSMFFERIYFLEEVMLKYIKKEKI